MAKRNGSRRHDATGRTSARPRYVALHHWLMRTAAWRDLDAVARCAYIELASRYAGPGSNNGRIPYSLREMAEALGTSKATAMRALARLQEHGFAVLTKQGAFSVKQQIASEWRLTEFPDDVTGEMASKDFVRWAKIQNAVSPQHPNGCRDETERVSR